MGGREVAGGRWTRELRSWRVEGKVVGRACRGLRGVVAFRLEVEERLARLACRREAAEASGLVDQESRMAEVEGRIPEHPVAAWGLQLPGPLPRTSW